jgi:hypothetical protein
VTRLLRLAAVALGFAVLAPCARADDDASPAGARDDAGDLTPEEMARIRRKFRQWDALDEVVRERIARNVARLRTMTPEEREKVVERARRLERAGALARAQFGDRLRRHARLTPDERRDAREGRLLLRAARHAVLRAATPEARASVEALPEADRVRWDACALALLRREAAAHAFARPPLSDPPPAGAPERIARLWDGEREAVLAAGGAGAPEAMRRRFARTVVEAHVAASLRDAVAAGPRGSLAERLAERFSERLPEAVSAVARAAERGVRTGALAAVCSEAEPARAAAQRARALLDVLRTLDRRRAALSAASADLGAEAARLEARLLVALGASVEDAEAYARATSPAEREAVLDRIGALRRLRGN